MALAACTGWRPQEPSLDGWPLGEESSCEPAVSGDPTYDVVGIASASLAGLPAGLAKARCYAEGAYVKGSEPTIMSRSGQVIVVVFMLDDGARRAIGVHCAAGCSAVPPPTGPSG